MNALLSPAPAKALAADERVVSPLVQGPPDAMPGKASDTNAVANLVQQAQQQAQLRAARAAERAHQLAQEALVARNSFD